MHPIRHVAAAVVALVLASALPVAAAVELQEGEGQATVTTSAYTVVLATTGPAVLASVTDRRTKRGISFTRAGFIITEERDRPEWSEAWCPAPVVHNEGDAKGTARFERRGADLACISEWSCPAATVRKTILFRDGSPAIDFSWETQVLRPVEELLWRAQTPEPGLFAQGRIYPGAERVPSYGEAMARFRSTPSLVYCHDGKTGIGVAAGPADGTRALASAIMPGPNAVQLTAGGEFLRWRQVPFQTTLQFRLLVGLTPDQALAWHRQNTPGVLPLQISSLAVDKLIHRSGETGRATAEVSNNTGGPVKAKLVARVETGLQTSRDLPAQALEVPAGATVRLPLEWPNPAEWGGAVAVALQDDGGRELDRAREFFTVSDNFSRVGQMVVFNPGWMNQDWMIPAWVEWAKRNYLGTIEYYCWAPDQVFDLTPDTEEFEPHTESQGVYRARLTRSFLQSLVRQAHEHGLRVLSMDTGFASLRGVLEHPEQIKYTVDGQPYLYNGNIHDGRRFNAVAAHVFTDERIRQWAREMCASVDMFGWDGVRFDWNFMPISPADPLHLTSAKPEDPKLQEWFDFLGRSAYDLFPRPDESGAAFCRAWRETVAARHPRFVYHGNYQVDRQIQARLPQYTQAACSGAGVLREGLLDVARHYPTWQKWVTALMATTHVVRPLDGQPAVGWMRGYAPGSVAHRTMQNCMMAAGYHWYGTASARGSIDDTHRRFAHALRFGEFFYDPRFLPVADPAAAVTVTGEGVERVLWEPFVYRREAGQSVDTLVHLVNLPRSDHIIMRHEEPPVRTGLTVTLPAGAGGKVTGAWLITPDPEPRAMVLTCQMDGAGRTVCRIPELRSMVSVLVRAGR